MESENPSLEQLIKSNSLTPDLIIASGTFGEIYKIKIGQTTLAIKKSSKNKNAQEMLFNEYKLLKKLKHKFVIKAYDFYVDPKNKESFMSMEFIEGQTLRNFINENENYEQLFIKKKNIFKQLIKVVDYLHTENNIIHRDIKPENILMTTDEKGKLNMKLIDFGSSKILEGNFLTDTYIGCPKYMPLEIDSYSFPFDVFGLGSTIYELFSGEPLPWEGKKNLEEKKKILYNINDYIENSKIKDNFLKECIKMMLAIKDDDRITIKELASNVKKQLFFFKNSRRKTSNSETLIKFVEKSKTTIDDKITKSNKENLKRSSKSMKNLHKSSDLTIFNKSRNNIFKRIGFLLLQKKIESQILEKCLKEKMEMENEYLVSFIKSYENYIIEKLKEIIDKFQYLEFGNEIKIDYSIIYLVEYLLICINIDSYCNNEDFLYFDCESFETEIKKNVSKKCSNFINSRKEIFNYLDLI